MGCFVVYILYMYLHVISDAITGMPSVIIMGISGMRVAFYALLFVGMLGVILKKENVCIAFLLICATFMIINYLLYSEIPPRYYAYINNFLTVCIPLALFAYYLDEQKTIKTFSNIGIGLSLMSGFCMLALLTGVITLKVYNNSFGYVGLFPMICMMHEMPKMDRKKKAISIVSLLMYVIFVLIYSSRGPLLILVAYLGYDTLVRVMNERATKKIISVILILILAMLVLVLFDNILLMMSEVLEGWNVSSRTLNLLMSDLTHSSGRDIMYGRIMDSIASDPLAVRGMAADTLLFGDQQYSHNLFLELIYEYGVLFGGAMCIHIAYIFVFSIQKENFVIDPLLTIFAFLSVVQLMFSSTLWQNFYFWMWIIRYYKTKKLKRGILNLKRVRYSRG